MTPRAPLEHQIGFTPRLILHLLTSLLCGDQGRTEDSFEHAQLSVRLEELQAEATKHRELETVLRSTLISAQQAGQEMKDQARREADLMVQEAHAESRRITRESAAEKRRLDEDVSRIRAQLVAAFEMLGQWPPRESTKSEEEAGDWADSDRRGLGRRHSQPDARRRTRRGQLLASVAMRSGVVPDGRTRRSGKTLDVQAPRGFESHLRRS